MEQNNGLKINKSKIARELGIDRKTVTKYLNGFEKSKHRDKGSRCDRFYDEIYKLLSSETPVFSYRSGLHQYLTDN